MIKRDVENKLIFGVCAGLSEHFNLDPLYMRGIFAVATLLGFGLPIIVYLVLAIIMPTK